MRAQLAEDRVRLQRVERALGDPRLAIAVKQQSVDDAMERLDRWARRSLDGRRQKIAQLAARLAPHDPRVAIPKQRGVLHRVSDRLDAAMRAQVARRGASLEQLAARLDAMSPLKVLARGYAIATKEDGRAVRGPADVKPAERIDLRLARGTIAAIVTDVGDDEGDP
jgi:exodeoxyribonuclease VII large subunit